MDECVDGEPTDRAENDTHGLHVLHGPSKMTRNEAMKRLLAEREKSKRITAWLRLWPFREKRSKV